MIPKRLIELDEVLEKIASAEAVPEGTCGVCEKPIGDDEESEEYENDGTKTHLHRGGCAKMFKSLLAMCPHPISTLTTKGRGAGQKFRRIIESSSWKFAEGLASNNDQNLMDDEGNMGILGGGTNSTAGLPKEDIGAKLTGSGLALTGNPLGMNPDEDATKSLRRLP